MGPSRPGFLRSLPAHVTSGVRQLYRPARIEVRPEATPSDPSPEAPSALTTPYPLRPLAAARYRAAYIVETCRRATDRVMQATGARSAFDASPVQRAFRDITMASKHELANHDGGAEIFGRTLLGLDPGNVPL